MKITQELFKLAMSDPSTRRVIKEMFKLKDDKSITLEIYKDYLKEIRRMEGKK